jgi:hypothetical protein
MFFQEVQMDIERQLGEPVEIKETRFGGVFAGLQRPVIGIGGVADDENVAVIPAEDGLNVDEGVRAAGEAGFFADLAGVVSVTDSPASMNPPGKHQRPRPGWMFLLTSRTRPSRNRMAATEGAGFR